MTGVLAQKQNAEKAPLAIVQASASQGDEVTLFQALLIRLGLFALA